MILFMTNLHHLGGKKEANVTNIQTLLGTGVEEFTKSLGPTTKGVSIRQVISLDFE
jgi:hypothetical protein